MKTEIAIISALALVLSVPLAFGEIVETKGQNYDLVENFFIGEANWQSHPERIMDGGWQNYALSNSAEKVIFNTNSVGSFIFDKNSCSYSIYENGFDGANIIPSVSAVATYLNNGQWQNLPINDEACTVTVEPYEDGVFLTSTKVITEDITEDVFISYTGTTENFYVNATNTNFDLIQSSNGTNTGYFNGETRVLESVEVEKFVQEIDLNIHKGFKETFKVTHDGNQELGISQTIHSGESITIGDQTINIAELNGQSFDRQFIIDNEAEILAITDSINYDFDTGIESLSNVNIIFDGDYKVNMDYADGGFVGYLEIDPTFGYVSTSDYGRSYGASSNNDCTLSTVSGGDASLNMMHADYCTVPYYKYDISSLPTGQIISNVNWKVSSATISGGGMDEDCVLREYTNVPSTNSQTTFNEGLTGTVLTDNNSMCKSAVSSDTVISFNSAGLSAIQSKYNTGQNWYAVSFFEHATSTSQSGTPYWAPTTAPQLSITYSVPIAPQPPTNLSTVTGIPIELDWTAPTDNGGSAITGYKVYRTQNEFALTELPDNSGSDSQLTFTDNEFLLHGFESGTLPDKSTNSISITHGSLQTVFETDFSECTDSTCGGLYDIQDSGSTSNLDINTANDVWRLDLHRSSSVFARASVPMPQAVCADKCSYEWKYSPNNLNTMSAPFMLSEKPATDVTSISTPNNVLGISHSNQAYLILYEQTHPQSGYTEIAKCNTHATTSNDQWVRMDKDGNAMTLTVWSDGFDGTEICSDSGTYSGTQSSFEHIMAWSIVAGGSNYMEIDIDDLTVKNFVPTQSTTGVISTGLQDPALSFTDSNLIDSTDDFSIGSWVKLDTSRDSTYDGTNNGATTGVTGKVGNAWDFDGSNDSVELPTLSGLIDQSDGSVSAWINFDSANDRTFLGSRDSSQNEGWTVRTDSSSRIELFMDNGGSPQMECRGSTSLSSGQWYHLVMSYDYTSGNPDCDMVTLYVDGSAESITAEVEQITSSDEITHTDSTWVGSQSNASGFVDGDIDQLIVYDKALSSSEVSALYNGGSGDSTPDTNGMVVHYNFEQTGNTLESQVPVPPTNTKLLGLNDVTFSVNPTSASVSTLVTGTSTNEVVWDESTATNASFSGNTITGTGGVWGTASKSIATYSTSDGMEIELERPSGSYSVMFGFGNGAHTGGTYHFSTLDYGINMGGDVYESNSNVCNSCSNLGAGTYKVKIDTSGAVTYWYKSLTGSYTTPFYTSTGTTASGDYSARVHIHTTYSALPEVTSTGLVSSNIISATGLADNTSEAKNYVFTRDGNDWAIYQNGVSQATATDSTSLGANAFTGKDSTLDGTNNGATTGQTGKFSNAWSFDGSNDYVSLPLGTAFDGLAGATISGWVNWDSSGGSYQTIFGVGDSDSERMEALIEQGGNIYLYAGNGQVSYSYIPYSNLPSGAWHHVALVYDGTLSNNAIIQMYVDGSLITNSGTSSSHGTTLGTFTNDGSIGKRPHASLQYFKGLQDEVVFYNKALTSTEVSALYNGGSGTTTPDTNGLVAHYNFEQTGNTLENQGIISTVNDYTTNIDGMIDEYFINSDVLTSSEVDTIYERGVAPTLLTTTGASTTEYDDSTVVGGNTYYFTLKSTNAIGDSDFLTPYVSGLAGTPPGVPTGVSTAINNPNTAPLDVTVSWSAPSNVGSGTLTGFEIYRDGVLVDTVGLVSSVPNTVPNSGSFIFGVKAISNHGSSGLSATSSITTPSIPDTPAAPTGSIITPDTTPLDVTVSWVAPNNGGSTITNYDLYRSTTSGSGFAAVQSGITGLTHIDTVPNSGSFFYTIVANNLVGSTPQSPELSISTPTVPNAVSDLAATVTSPTQIDLAWSAPSDGGSNIDLYKVMQGGSQIDTTTSTSYSVTGLTMNTSYDFNIVVNNSVGDSATSNTATGISFGVPSIVTNLTAIEVTSTTMDLTWDQSNDNGYPVLGYKVYRDGSLVQDSLSRFLNQTSLSYLTSYDFEVKAYNTIGDGASDTLTQSTLPDKPTNLVVTPSTSTTQLSLTWSAPDNPAGVTGYQVQRENGIGNGFTNIATTTSPGFLDTGLTTNVFYNYRVMSTSSVGDSFPSNTYSQTTYHIPDPVTVISATAGQFIDATLTWTQPTNLYGYLDGYRIYSFNPTTNVTSTLISDTNSNLPTYTVTNLDPTTTYHFKVSPLTIHGDNDSGTVVNATATSENILGAINMPTETNPTQVPILFEQSFSGNNTIVKMKFDPALDVNCDVDYKFASTTTTYTNLAETAELDGKVSHTMTFNDSDNDIIEMLCYDSTDPTLKGQHLLTMTTVPFKEQTDSFKNGEYGLSGQFGSLDLITLFVVLIAMVGFNRYNPIVGVGIMSAIISALAWLEIIEPITLVGGILTMVFVVAIVMSRRRN